MNQTSPMNTAAAAGAAAIVTPVVAYVASLFRLALPADVLGSIVVLLVAGAHWVSQVVSERYGSQTPAAPAAPVAPIAQSGFAMVRMLLLIAVLGIIVACTPGCTGLGAQMYAGYETAAAKGVRAADDNAVKTLKDSACLVPFGAVQRDAVMSQIAKLACGELPSIAGGLTAADLEALRKLTNPNGVQLTFPAASGAK